MVPNDWFDRVWEVDGFQYVCSNGCMNLHPFVLRLSEGTWLVQDVLWNRKLAGIMQQCCCSQGVELALFLESQTFRQRHGVSLDPPNVAVRYLVLCVNSQSQSFDC